MKIVKFKNSFGEKIVLRSSDINGFTIKEDSLNIHLIIHGHAFYYSFANKEEYNETLDNLAEALFE